MKPAEIYVKPSHFGFMTDDTINGLFDGSRKRKIECIVITSDTHLGEKPYPTTNQMTVEEAREYLAGKGSMEMRNPNRAIYIFNPSNSGAYRANVNGRDN